MFAPDSIWQEHKTPKDNSYIPKDGLVIAWFVHVVKAFQLRILFVVKVGTIDQFIWITLMGLNARATCGCHN